MGLKPDPSQFTVQLMEPINKLQFIFLTASYFIIAILFYPIIQLLYDGR